MLLQLVQAQEQMIRKLREGASTATASKPGPPSEYATPARQLHRSPPSSAERATDLSDEGF